MERGRDRPKTGRDTGCAGPTPERFWGVYTNLNADEFLSYKAAIEGVGLKAAKERIDGLLAFVKLLDARKRPLSCILMS